MEPKWNAVPARKPDLPQTPQDWSYEKAVREDVQLCQKWKSATEELVCHLYVARKELSRPGNPWGKKATWGEYCRAIGIPQNTANRWLRDAFGKQITCSSEQVIIPETCATTDLYSLVSSKKTFGTIYADPPWKYGNQATRASTDNHYDTLSPEEIATLPVSELTAERAHLHLWTTNAFLFECPAICVPIETIRKEVGFRRYGYDPFGEEWLLLENAAPQKAA